MSMLYTFLASIWSGLSESMRYVDKRSLKVRLEERIEEQNFISQSDMETFCSLREVRIVIPEKEAASFIQEKAPKLFLILVLLSREDLVPILAGRECTDEGLFRLSPRSPRCHEWTLTPFPELESVADDFLKKQWLIPPPLSRTIHHEFPAVFLEHFPQVEPPRQHIWKTSKPWCKIRLASGSVEGCTEPVWVHCKQTKEDQGDRWVDIINEIEIMRNLEHPNIVSVLASFEVFEVHAAKRLFIILEWASEGDMARWMMRQKAPEFLKARDDPSWGREGYIFRVIENLASAVSYIHRQKENSIICHFDLKPRNILLFGAEQQFIWKICDFGSSRKIQLKNEKKVQVADSTPEYAAPECYTQRGEVLPTSFHSKELDVFALGCIFLELQTVMVHGWDGNEVEKFRQSRKHSEEHEDPDDDSFRSSPEVVKQQIENLKTRYTGSHGKRLSDLSNLIQDMLEPKPEQRVQSFEVELRIFDLLHIHTKNSRESTRQRKIADLIQRPVHGLDSFTNNPLTRSRRGDEMLTGMLKTCGWDDEDRWQFPQEYRRTAGNYGHLPELNFVVDSPICRDDILSKIQKNFEAVRARGTGPRVCLYGLSGSGKSHIAYTYANACWTGRVFGSTSFQPLRKHVFWIEASTQARFTDSCRDACEAIYGESPKNRARHAERFRKWLNDSSNDSWLVVLDDLSDSSLAKEIAQTVNVHNRGQILITSKTRNASIEFDAYRTSIEIPELTEEEACWMLAMRHRYSRQKPADSSPEHKLVGMLPFRLPLVIQMIARYLEYHEQPMENLTQKFRETKPLDVLRNEVNQASKPGTKTIFRILDDFWETSDRGSYDDELFLLCACFYRVECDTLWPWWSIMHGENQLDDSTRQKQWPILRGRLRNFQNRCFIKPIGDPQDDRFEMHELIQSSVLKHFGDNDISQVLSAYDSMLQSICFKYTHSYAEISQKKPNMRLSKTYWWKEKQMPNVENFINYIDCLTHANKAIHPQFTFSARAWKCICEFSNFLREQERNDDALKLCDFAKKCGIQGQESDQEVVELQIRLSLELARIQGARYFDFRAESIGTVDPGSIPQISDRDEQLYLAACSSANDAIERANEANKRAGTHETCDSEWFALEQICQLNLSRNELVGSRNWLSKMKQLLPRCSDPEWRKIQHAQLRADLMVREAMSSDDKEQLFKARNRLIDSVQRLKADKQVEVDKIANAILKLAIVDLEIPHITTLREAKRILHSHLNGLRERYPDERDENPVYWKVRRLLGLCYLRLGEITLAEEAFEDLLKGIDQRLLKTTSIARKVALSLRDTYHLNSKPGLQDDIEEKYNLRPIDKDNFRLGFWFPNVSVPQPPTGKPEIAYWEFECPLGCSGEDLKVFHRTSALFANSIP